MKPLTTETTKKVIRNLLSGDDYRAGIVELIDANFLDYVVEFLKRVARAKSISSDARNGIDWYTDEFLNEGLPSNDLIIHSGLNKKTIVNMHGSERREIVIKAAKDHFLQLYESIEQQVDNDSDIGIELTLTFNNTSVNLDIKDSLIVMNTLAVKRAELRGSSWSTVGKGVEAPLMKTLCNIYSVDSRNYRAGGETSQSKEITREIDFYLINQSGKEHKCEVKLVGPGNPEGADSAFARDTDMYIADYISERAKKQLESKGIEWVELRATDGFVRFEKVLDNIGVPYEPIAKENNSKIIDRAIDRVFNSKKR